jgi:hypothetical protein
MSQGDSTERTGVMTVGLLSEQAGWAFREQPRPDRGIDAQLEGRTNGLPDGRLIGLQIKSGPSHFKQRIAGGWRYYVDPAHIAYWAEYAVPVLLVLHNTIENAAYWQVVNADTTYSTGKLVAVDVPEANAFGRPARSRLDALTKAQGAADGLRDRRAALDLPWMWMLDEGERLLLEVEQSLDPPDGRCVLRLIGIKGAEVSIERTWPWTFLSGADFAGKISELFPWADKTVDQRYYRARAVPDYLNAHATWLPEYESYDYDVSFDDWCSARFGSALVPYAVTPDGSTALWRLELQLNDVGAAALAHDKDEMMAEAWMDDDLPSPSGGHYAMDFIEQTYSPQGGLECLMYYYDNDDQDLEALLIEKVLTDDDGRPVPTAVAAILRHAGADPTQGMAAAFLSRFAHNLDADDGIWEIRRNDVCDWLHELALIAKHGASPE